jgi:hypothetical protein
MTHDELLAKIDTLEARYTDYPTYLALRAVVELHKPDEYCCPVCGPVLDICGVEYPCPTVRAIEKELA